MLRPKLVLLLTEIFQSFMSHKEHGAFYTSAVPRATWYEPLFNSMKTEISQMLPESLDSSAIWTFAEAGRAMPSTQAVMEVRC